MLRVLVRRTIIAISLVLLLAQATAILVFSTAPAGSLISNLVQFCASLLAAFACFHARKRAQGAARAFWTLFGTAFLIWCAAQAGWTYSENWLRRPLPTPSIPHFLFRLFGLPLVVALFLEDEDEPEGVNWLRVIDFAQVGIVFLFFYFELFFDSENNLGARRVWRWITISDLENWLIAMALFLRSRFASTALIRQLNRRMWIPLIAYAFVSSVFNVVTDIQDPGQGRWLDLLWTLPFVLAAVAAVQEQQLQLDPSSARPRLGPAPVTFAPALLPLLVVVLSLSVAPQFRLVGFVALTGSFGCFAARMLIVQFRLRSSISAHRASEDRFYTAFHASPNAIVISRIDPPSFMEVNKTFERLSGYSREESIGKNLSELNMWVDPAHRDVWNTALREGRIVEGMEVPFRTKSGEVRWGVVSAAFIEIGRRRCVLAITRDVTERRRAEESLRASEEKFSKAFHASPDAMMIADAETRKIVEVNDQFVRLSGYTREETIGRTGADVGIYGGPEDRAKFMEAMQQYGCVHGLELRLRKKDGQIGMAWVSVEPIQVGARQCLLGVARDITLQKRAEEALRASESRYRDLTDNANDVIFTLDLKGNFTSLNRAGERLTGFQCAKGEKFNISSVVAADQLEFAGSMMERALLGNPPSPFNLDIISKEGRRLTLELNGRAILEDARPAGIHCIARDVSERNLLEAQLRQAQKMEAVGLLAGGVAHDFNNLLSVILGYSDLLADDVGTEGKAPARIEQIRSAAIRAAALTRQLLAFSRQQVLQPRLLDLNHVVTDMVKLLHRLIGEHITLATTLDPELGRVKADPSQMEQVILNLAVNARDAMPTGGTLSISSRNIELDQSFCSLLPNLAPGRYVMLAVSDTGVGMSTEVQARIFEPFFTTKEKGRGTGLGLSTVFGIVQQSGGHISAHSDLGHGSTFKVYLPYVDQPAEPVHPSPGRSFSARGTEKILVAEDEHALRDLIHQILEDHGYNVVSAADPLEAQRLAREHQTIDLLLTDVIMPGTNGRELADSILKLHPNAKIIFMSGYTDDLIVGQGVLEPPFAFLNKPVTAAALIDQIRTLLDS